MSAPAEALRESIRRRAPLGTLAALRLLDGRVEGLAGWTVDRYGDAFLVQCFERGGAPPATLDALVQVLRDEFGPDIRVVAKERGAGPAGDVVGRLVAGEPFEPDPDDPLAGRPGRTVVQEGGLLFGVDLLHGTNTGLFLDARPLRAWVRERSAGRRILNLFSYTAAFGVAAAAGGARSVTNVDIVPSALERGRANFALNGLPSDSRTHLQSDVFRFLKQARRRDERWDGFVVDPPPVATGGPRRSRGRGRGFDPSRDWSALARDVLALRSPGAWVLLMSAARSPAGFEEQLPDEVWTALDRGPDFPGARGRGMRGLALVGAE